MSKEYTLVVTCEASITCVRNDDDPAPTPAEMVGDITRVMDRTGGLGGDFCTFYACDLVAADGILGVESLSDRI